jgi:hypothetical protein
LRFPSPSTVSACGASLGEPDTARCEKIANAVVAGLPFNIEAVVRGDVEGTKCLPSPRCALPEVFVEHLFPTRGVDAGGVGDHTVEIEQDGVVPLAGTRGFAFGLLHRSLSIATMVGNIVH